MAVPAPILKAEGSAASPRNPVSSLLASGRTVDRSMAYVLSERRAIGSPKHEDGEVLARVRLASRMPTLNSRRHTVGAARSSLGEPWRTMSRD